MVASAEEHGCLLDARNSSYAYVFVKTNLKNESLGWVYGMGH